jgi:transcriptional regulator with GAF, ATPase, and Fis domain
MEPINTKSVGKCLEKVEVLRSSLRWTSSLDKEGVAKISRQISGLRDDLLFLTRIDKYKTNPEARKKVEDLPSSRRRELLMANNFVFEGVIGESKALLKVLETLNKSADSDFPVLIDGESGTGKELLARVVHHNSSRSDRELVTVNCGAIPDSLVESELFGHVKGAFTGADKDRDGKFERAHKGSLFLDEIGELDLKNQVKLLRALQTGDIQRVGSDKNITVDVRVIAATNRNLQQMVREGRFREDLYYRIAVITVTSPPLRERQDEIPLLIDYFSTDAAEKLGKKPISLSERLRDALTLYRYPGNIRELQNIIYRLSCLADRYADIEHLPDHIVASLNLKVSENGFQRGKPEELSLEEVRQNACDMAERRFLTRQLEAMQGNVTEIANKIQLNRSYLQKLLKKHGLQSKRFKKAAPAAKETPQY